MIRIIHHLINLSHEKNAINLIEQIGLQFDEALQLFSEETLKTMVLSHVVGGGSNQYCTNTNCKCYHDPNDNRGTTAGGTTSSK